MTAQNSGQLEELWVSSKEKWHWLPAETAGSDWPPRKSLSVKEPMFSSQVAASANWRQPSMKSGGISAVFERMFPTRRILIGCFRRSKTKKENSTSFSPTQASQSTQLSVKSLRNSTTQFSTSM